jgi:outer membrane protein
MIERLAFVRGLAMSCFFAVLSAPVLAAAAEEGFPDSTLAGIYELATVNDLTLEQARAQLRVGGEERELALAGLLPRLQAGWSYVESENKTRGRFPVGGDFLVDNATNTDADTRTWEVSLRQPLFDLPAWFRFQQGVELSRLAQVQFSAAQQDLIQRTVVAYFEVLRASANLRAARSQEAAVDAQLEQVRQRFEVGMVAITDVYEAQAAHDLAVAQRITDEGTLGIAGELLSVLTGRPHGELWVLERAFPVVDPDPVAGDAWVEFARQNNLDIQVAQRARDAAQRGARAAASEHLPKVDLSLSYADATTDVSQKNVISGDRVDFPNDQERGFVALNVTVPLYTGGFTSAARRQADARADTQQAGYEGTVRNIIQETRALHIRVMSGVARSAARAQAVTSTRSALEAAEVGYEVGTRNVVDVLNAQREYFLAVRDYESTILDYVQDQVRLKRRAGTLTPADVYELNRWLVAPPPPSINGDAREGGGDAARPGV